MKYYFSILLIPLLLNSQVKDIVEYGSKINDLIADKFEKSDSRYVNITFLDSMFSYALTIADSNIGDALLFCSIGSMTYEKFDVKIPLLNLKIPINVFSKIDNRKFQQKVKNLPSQFFGDSPKSEFGDKDKVVHFFTFAYLSFILGKNFAEQLGMFVEFFEESFKIDGKVDYRDLKINELGARFGEILHYKIILPSVILAKEFRLSYGKNSNN